MSSLILVAVLAGLFSTKNTRNILTGCLALIITITTTGDLVRERFYSIKQTSVFGANQSEVEYSAESRLHLWEICIRMWIDNPIIGVGPDQFSQYVQNYPIALADGSYLSYNKGKEAHNLWLQTLAEMGLLGFVPYALFFILPLRRHLRIAYQRSHAADHTQLRNSLAIVGGVATFIFAANFVSVEGAEFAYYLIVFAIGAEKIGTKIENTKVLR